ncbi:MAG: peptidyl-prolyl cis-trans isomerase [Deltaproteobacteria bacterium]|nr:peptidyl-prolyl cis-trans isomerase [Deltaproteobacteria bacterium]
MQATHRQAASGDGPRHALWLRVLVRNRLLHFVVLGGSIFAIAPRVQAPDTIVINQSALQAMERAEAQRLAVPRLSEEQAREVRYRAVSDEVMYREARRLGLDRDDPVVRQRLIQKVLFLAQDLAGASAAAGDDELRRFFESTRAQWTRPARARFLHVYAGPARRDWLTGLKAEAVSLETQRPGMPPSLGDAFPLSRKVDATREVIASDYSDSFAEAVFTQPLGSWQGPVRSKHGWHLVKVIERDEGGTADFDDVRGKLPLHYLVARKKEITRDFLRGAASRYRIEVRGEPAAAVQTARALPRNVEVD